VPIPEDDGLVMPSRIRDARAQVDCPAGSPQAIHVAGINRAGNIGKLDDPHIPDWTAAAARMMIAVCHFERLQSAVQNGDLLDHLVGMSA